MANEIAATNHLRTKQNKITLCNRTDLNSNYNRGGDTKIHTHGIMNEIRKLKNKAPGISGINRHILINCQKNITCFIKNIFNAVLSIGYFPDQFKTAKIIPIPKPGRPKTDLYLFSKYQEKTLEKTLNKRIQAHINLHNQLNPNKHGFLKKNRGTHTSALTHENTSKKTVWRLFMQKLKTKYVTA